ncbi:MAG: ABC transporter substrate-binding protein [Anaerolineae bacterium]
MRFRRLTLLLCLSLAVIATACRPRAATVPNPPGEPAPRAVAATPVAAPTRAANLETLSTPRPRDALVVAVTRDPLSLDPGDLVDPEGLLALRQIFDTLTGLGPNGEVTPQLATAWRANADATEWTFTLRQGVRFHDGTPLTASAVKFNFDRWFDPEFAAGSRGEGKQFQVWSDIFGGYRGAGSLVTDVIAGDGEVTFRLARPAAYFPAFLALPYFGLSSPDAVTRAGGRYGAPDGGAVGTGPFRLKEWQPGAVRLERVPDYWGGPAAAETLTLQAFGDADAQLAALADGRADLAPDIPADKAPNLQARGLVAVSRPMLAVSYLGINQRYRPLNDSRVRQAIAGALQGTALAAALPPQSAIAADQFVPPSLCCRIDPAPLPSAAQAKDLLTQAGFREGLSEVAGPDGKLEPLELWYSSPPLGPSTTPLAKAVAAQLEAAGIKVALREDEWASFLAERKQGQFPLFLLSFPTPSGRSEALDDPYAFLSPLFGPLSVGETGYAKPVVVDALKEGETNADQERRRSAYRQVAQVLREDMPRVPLVYPLGLAVTRGGVEGYVPSALGAESLAPVRTPR